MKSYQKSLTAFIVVLLGAVGLGLAARGAEALPGDLLLSHAVQRAIPFNDGVAAFWKSLGKIVEYLPYVAVAVALLLRQWWGAVWLALAGFPVAYFGESFLKPLFGRPRPAADDVIISQAAKGLSFPSGTAMLTMAVVGMAIYLARRAAKQAKRGSSSTLSRIIVDVSFVFLLLSNLARIHVGVHWATDLLGGWLFAGAWVLLLIAAHQKMSEKS